MPVVAVTGGSGKLGRAVVRELLEHGWTVMNVDQRPSPDRGARFLRIDLTDFGQVVEAFTGIDQAHTGVDAVVHLGAIPGPAQAGNAATFGNNILSTYHVFSAARLARVRNVVWASSETLFGYPFDDAPERLPLEETCEPRPNADYALEKLLAETAAAQFCRRDPQLSMTGLRFSNVLDETDYVEIPQWQDDPMLRRWNLWSYIDTRDGARAVRLALEQPRPGSRVYAIFNDDTVMERPTQELVDLYYADVPRERDFVGHEALVSTARAAAELGWRPQHTWRD
ncbi:NAD(P)-dependent oxidoreductase [Nocardioides fonticola]|uniref:NAD(P)-dependent oxidoreductase n=1 Tax=Nocardioides fonticola TaxID=450363 RepID=A0ABP7XGC9_9ACTN